MKGHLGGTDKVLPLWKMLGCCFIATVIVRQLIFKAPTELERRVLILSNLMITQLTVLIESLLLFFNKCFMDCFKFWVNFQSSKKADFGFLPVFSLLLHRSRFLEVPHSRSASPLLFPLISSA